MDAKAVFLSYASQDAEAARRICDALRAAGVEVWFDQSELRGGDAWDQKIRKQIKECALFVPVISANTQARLEGYFRLEWKLAEDRSHLMAKGRPFILPVTLDATSEREAQVPESFLAVQWTRLAVGEAPVAFCERVRVLLSGGLGPQPPPSAAVPELPGPTALDRRRSSRRFALFALGGVALTGTAILFFAGRRPDLPASATSTPTLVPAVKPPKLGPKSIAVLPFENLSENKDASAFFAEGMHEDLITNLISIRELHCVPRTTAVSYRGSTKSNREIADELGVAYLFTGTVRRADTKLRLTGTLIRGQTDEALWTKPYDKDISNAGAIFDIQAGLAHAIAGELQAVLSPQEKKLVERRPTENAAAYDLFMRARQVRNNSPSTANGGIETKLLREAVALDPKFALAWAWLAYSHGWTYLRNDDHSALRREEATNAINAAVRLAPDDPEIILNRGNYFFQVSGDYGRAIQDFERVGQMQPGALAWRWALANVQRRQGRWVESLDGFRHLIRVEPENWDYSQLFFGLAMSGRRFDEAIAERKRALHIAPNSLDARYTIARAHFMRDGSWTELEAVVASLASAAKSVAAAATYRRDFAALRGDCAELVRLDQARAGPAWQAAVALTATGDAPGARKRLEAAAELLRTRLKSDSENPRWWGELARIEVLMGRPEEALRCAEKSVALLPDTENHVEGAGSRTDLAFVLAWAGDKERATAEYAKILRTPIRDNYLIENVHVMKNHPAFSRLRGYPPFEALLDDPKNNTPLF